MYQHQNKEKKIFGNRKKMINIQNLLKYMRFNGRRV